MSITGSCCVGIVEDDKLLVQVYEKMLKRHSIPVCMIAYDGVEAVKLFRESERKPNVIIMDQRMFNMNGTEAAKKLCCMDPRPSIIFISADMDTRAEAFESGAKVFLRKPVSIKVILEAIELVLRNCSTHKYYYDGHRGFVAS